MSVPSQSHRGSPQSRRASPRVGAVLKVHYRNAGHLLVNYCTNLSRGGLFVPCAQPLEPGRRLTLSLNIPGDNEPTELTAEVRWVRTEENTEGPAGMGLSFKDIDGVLGRRIDAVVQSFTPLQIAIVSSRPPMRSHLVAQMRSLLTCETTVHQVSRALTETISGCDLVIIDVDSAPEDARALLDQLANLPQPPPRVALCAGSARDRRRELAPLAKIVRTPVEADDLRANVLEAVTQIAPDAFETIDPDGPMASANDRAT